MSKIAVLGWGSLIWNPRNLSISSKWFKDGPHIPIEFARISNDDRLTVVVYPDAKRIRVLWAYMDYRRLEDAIKNLIKREETIRKYIGYVDISTDKYRSNVVPEITTYITEWANKKNIDAVIWTDLYSNFEKVTGAKFNEENVIKYLKNLKPNAKKKATEYVKRAPFQIQTELRKIIEECLVC